MLGSTGWFRAAIVTALVALAFPASAVRVEVQAGRSYMDSFGVNAVFVEGVFAEHRFGDSGFSWSPDVSVGWVDGRELARYRGNPDGTGDHIWLVAAGARFHYGQPGDWYQPLFLSFQPALQKGHTMALSSGFEFVSTVGWQGKRFSVQVRHASNAGLREPNRGETMLVVGVAFDL